MQRRGGGVGGVYLSYFVLVGRRMHLSYFVLVDVLRLVFVLVDERLIWYLCMYLGMSLLQHLLMPLSRILVIFSI